MSEEHFQHYGFSSTPDVRWIIDYIAKERCDGNRSAAVRLLVRVASMTLGVEFPITDKPEPQKGENDALVFGKEQ